MKGILCFGDSITFGRGEVPAIGWVGRLKDYFESKDAYNGVYNLGIPGDTSEGLLKRFDSEANGRIHLNRVGNQFIILIAIGTNDCKYDAEPEDAPNMSIEQFISNMIDLIEKASKYEAKIMLIGLPPVDETKTLPYEETWFTQERVKLFNDAIKAICSDAKLDFLDIFEIMSKENYFSLLEDGLHPNSEGYDYMFTKIKEFLENKFPGFL